MIAKVIMIDRSEEANCWCFVQDEGSRFLKVSLVRGSPNKVLVKDKEEEAFRDFLIAEQHKWS